MNFTLIQRRCALLTMVAALAACAPLPPGPPRGPHADPARMEPREREMRRVPQSASRQATPPRPGGAAQRQDGALRDGIALYHDGKYDAAIARLGTLDASDAPMRERLEALKYIAFSQCLTRRQDLCRASFERALRLDPRFDLSQGEHGHPMWGPVFEQARSRRR